MEVESSIRGDAAETWRFVGKFTLNAAFGAANLGAGTRRRSERERISKYRYVHMGIL